MRKKTLSYSKKCSALEKLSFLLFPPRCVLCGRKTHGENICKDCFKKIKFLDYPLIEHRGNAFYYAITDYEGAGGELVKKLKFYGSKPVAFDIARIFANFIGGNEIIADFVSFVPMTFLERKKRGFNQSKLIAENLSRISNLKFFDRLEKVRNTEKQVGLSRTARTKNIRNAFMVKGIKISDSIIIVDDVYTTGATAHLVVRAVSGSLRPGFNVYFIAFSRKI